MDQTTYVARSAAPVARRAAPAWPKARSKPTKKGKTRQRTNRKTKRTAKKRSRSTPVRHTTKIIHRTKYVPESRYVATYVPNSKSVEEKIKYTYEAIEHAEKSIALDKNLTDAYNILASCLFFFRLESSLQHDREKNETRFREVAEKSYSLDPNNPDSVMNMAHLYRISHDETKYREHVNKAIDINPHHSRSLQAKGLLCLNECDYDNSIDLLNRANESNRKGVPFFETMLFFCHLGKNDWLSANQSVERNMRENDHSRYHAFKAIVLAHEGKIEESQHWLKKYQENRPEIKTLEDYEQVVPQINQEVKDILLNGMRKAGLK